MSLTTTTSSALQFMQTLAGEIDSDEQLSMALVFLRVAAAGGVGIDQGKLQDELQLSSAATSRTVQSLGKVHYSKKRDGYDLVDRAFDATDNRRRMLRLTPKGERLMAKLMKR